MGSEVIIFMVESLNDDDAGSKRPRISHLHEIWLYKAITEELPIVIRAASKFVKNLSKPARFDKHKC